MTYFVFVWGGPRHMGGWWGWGLLVLVLEAVGGWCPPACWWWVGVFPLVEGHALVLGAGARWHP